MVTQVVYEFPTISKDDAPCCLARRDADGRLPVGWCSDECVRRPVAVRVRSA